MRIIPTYLSADVYLENSIIRENLSHNYVIDTWLDVFWIREAYEVLERTIVFF